MTSNDIQRIVIFGACGSGKSALTIKFVQDFFIDEYDPTIEDSYRKEVNLDGVPSMLDILDTAGEEEYLPMRDRQIRSGQGFLIVYDVTSKSSFEEVHNRVRHIRRIKDKDDACILIVGNKADLETQRQVGEEEAVAYATKEGMPFIETSAKTGMNVEEMFLDIARMSQGIQPSAPAHTHRRRCVLS